MTQPLLISVVGMSKENAIATDESIPWNYPQDKRQYKARIRGNPLIIGRKTYDIMIKYETELLNESEISVLTTDSSYQTDISHHLVQNSKQETLNWINNQKETVYNIGGGEIYKLFFEETDRLIVSHIPESINGTVFFPEIKENNWEILSTEEFDRFTIHTYQRVE